MGTLDLIPLVRLFVLKKSLEVNIGVLKNERLVRNKTIKNKLVCKRKNLETLWGWGGGNN